MRILPAKPYCSGNFMYLNPLITHTDAFSLVKAFFNLPHRTILGFIHIVKLLALIISHWLHSLPAVFLPIGPVFINFKDTFEFKTSVLKVLNNFLCLDSHYGSWDVALRQIELSVFYGGLWTKDRREVWSVLILEIL